MKTKCEICDRTFKDESGLQQHNAAKHSNSQPASNTTNKKPKNVKLWTIAAIILAIIIGFSWWSLNSLSEEQKECKTAPATEQNIGGHTNLAQHIHSNLKIVINGKENQIPANIGITSGIMRPVHTHEGDGKIHVEGPCVRDYTLGDFFNIWKKEFNKDRIFDNYASNGTLTMKVNGKENQEFGEYIMKDDDAIVIEYILIEYILKK